ncbi:MAG: hypothetical protein HY098_01975 [Nitrospinae bacterium]|nr:hypothetical protein [Nitrospinota bacterium]
MIHRRGSGRENKTGGRPAAVECRVCACPNRPGAARCMYCGSALPGAGPGFGLPRLDGIRRFFGGLFGKKRGPLFKASVSALLSTLLFALDAHFLLRAARNGGYFEWAAVLLLAFYAGTLLRNAYLLLFDKRLD